MKTNKFFVYGTLKVGGRFATKFDGHRTSVKKATANGSMYSVGNGNFPAVMFNTNNKIFGEIHEYKNEEEIQKAFNRIEGFYGEGDSDNLYNILKIKVKDTDGNTVECLTYEFNHSVDCLPKIDSGIWEI